MIRFQFLAPFAEPRPELTPAGSPNPRRFEAVLDTGSGLSVFAYQTWKPFEPEIRWPQRIDSGPRKLTVLGGKWPFRFGQVRLLAFDKEEGFLPPAWTLGLFLEDSPGAPPVNVLGLRSPFLERRQLRHAGTDARRRPVWWLEDA